jgi:hypothetical protein
VKNCHWERGKGKIIWKILRKRSEKESQWERGKGKERLSGRFS